MALDGWRDGIAVVVAAPRVGAGSRYSLVVADVAVGGLAGLSGALGCAALAEKLQSNQLCLDGSHSRRPKLGPYSQWYQESRPRY